MWTLIRSNPSYLRYWLSLLGMEFAEWIRNMVLTYAVYDLSHGSARAVSLILLCEFVPMFFAPFIGVLSDRWDRKRGFIISIAIQGLLLIGISLTLHWHLLVLIYIGALLSATAAIFSQSSAAGYLVQFVPLKDRQTATALQQVVLSLMMLLGPPLGTAVYMAIGGQWSIAASGVLFIVAVVLNLNIQVARPDTANETPLTYWEDLKGGLFYARKHFIMRFIITTGLLVGCSAGILNVLEIFLVTKFLHLPKTWLSILLFVQGGGMLLATPVLNRLKISMKKLLPMSLLWFGIGMLLMIALHQWWLTLLGYLVFSVGNVAANMAIGTLMKTEVEESYQGRMSALFNTSYGLMTGLFMVITGQLQALLGVRRLIGGSSILILCSSALLFWAIFRHLRNNTASDTDYVEQIGL